MAVKKLKQSELARQLFPNFLREVRSGFGGAKTHTSHPTQARPFARNTPIHVVFRSEMAVGKFSFFAKARKVEKLLGNESSRVGAKVLDCVNGGNHLHVVLTFRSPLAQKRFLRTFSARLSRLMLGAKKGLPKLGRVSTSGRGSTSLKQKFFSGRPYSRIADWGKQLAALKLHLLVEPTKDSTKSQHVAAQNRTQDFENFGLLCFSG